MFGEPVPDDLGAEETFLTPRGDLQMQNWGNHQAQLESYRALRAVLDGRAAST